MKNSSSKTSLRIGGKMSEKGADRAGFILSLAAFIAASGFAVAAIAYVLK